MKNILIILKAVIIVSLITGCTVTRGDQRSINSNDGGNVNYALIIIDVQNDYFEGGRHALYNPSDALSNIESILKHFRERNLPVIHVQHINSRGTGFFEPDTIGVQIHENITPLANETLIIKRDVSSFTGTELETILRRNGINGLIITGMQTNVCVRSAVNDCIMRGIRVILLEDACAARSLDIHNDTINSINSLPGDFVVIMKTGEYIK